MQNLDLVSSNSLLQRFDLEKAPDLVHRVRGLGFFKRHIAHGVASIGRHGGLAARFDDRAAPTIFLAWISALMEQRSYAQLDRRDYIVFGAGMLLKTLLDTPSIRLLAPPSARVPKSTIPSIWPEGFLATSYCLSVLDAVFEQEEMETVTLSPAAEDSAIWESFRENVTADPRLAIPYLDLFIGNEPNWSEPTWARNRASLMRRMGRRLQS